MIAVITAAFSYIGQSIRRTIGKLRRRLRPPLPGRFQAYSHTLPDRYPWLFEFARGQVPDSAATRLLSFGCSRGDEVFSLRKYFPAAAIKGIDIDPHNVAVCKARLASSGSQAVSFGVAATTNGEMNDYYDAIFCLAVLCLGDLTASGAQRSDPHLHFEDFDRVVSDFARCLKPGGLLLLHVTNFRFCDSSIAGQFDTVLEADAANMTAGLLFDRENKLLKGERYYPVAFRKRDLAGATMDSAIGAI
jgi:SAM-dependent methyltransferase